MDCADRVTRIPWEFHVKRQELGRISASKPAHSQLFSSVLSLAASLENSQREQSQPVPVMRVFLGSAVAKLEGREEEVELEEEEKRFFRAPGIF